MSNSIRKIGSSVSASACVHSEQSPFQIPPCHESEKFFLCHEVPIGKQYGLINNTLDFLDFFYFQERQNELRKWRRRPTYSTTAKTTGRSTAAAVACPLPPPRPQALPSPPPPLPPPFTARALTTTLVSQSARRRRSMKTTTTLCGIEGEIGDQFKTVKRNEKKESVAVSPSKRLF